MMKLSIVSILFFPSLLMAKVTTICNYSTSPDLYLAYSSDVSGFWWVQGWRHLEQGSCSDFYHEGSYFYYYADDNDGREWGGDFRHCVLDTAFKIRYSADTCANGYWLYFDRMETESEFSELHLVD